MENEFYTDEFEQLIKEKADLFRMYPSKRVWHSIYNNLHPGRRWPSVVMSLLLISSLILIGHLNTGDNAITRQINNTAYTNTTIPVNNTQNTNRTKRIAASESQQYQVTYNNYNNAFDDVITNETDFYTYTIVKNNRPPDFYSTAVASDPKPIVEINATGNNEKDVVLPTGTNIKATKPADLALNIKKHKTRIEKATTTDDTGTGEFADADVTNGSTTATNGSTSLLPGNNKTAKSEVTESDKKTITNLNATEDKNTLTNEERSWIENYALLNKPAISKWKGRLAYQFYVTPAVNYRKLSLDSKGSATPAAISSADINNSISQKPGLGIEAGFGVSYAFAKKLQFKAGVQLNYTNYNIDADQTNHPILTTILLNDPATGNSFIAARTTTTSNAFNTTALQPVTLHNTTYQISVPLGFAYKISTQRNVDWFAGASVQPTYVFGGKAHLISTDLKSYVYDPSSINSWNLNLGFETYMNFKLGTYNLQVGPQVRYQLNSTYRKNVALIEKPYAVGLKVGLSKGF